LVVELFQTEKASQSARCCQRHSQGSGKYLASLHACAFLLRVSAAHFKDISVAHCVFFLSLAYGRTFGRACGLAVPFGLFARALSSYGIWADGPACGETWAFGRPAALRRDHRLFAGRPLGVWQPQRGESVVALAAPQHPNLTDSVPQFVVHVTQHCNCVFKGQIKKARWRFFQRVQSFIASYTLPNALSLSSIFSSSLAHFNCLTSDKICLAFIVSDAVFFSDWARRGSALVRQGQRPWRGAAAHGG
jgi:hypothetical protein